MNKQFGFLILICLLTCFQFACTLDKGKNIPNVSNIKVDAHIERLEKQIFDLDTTNISPGLQKIVDNHSEFMDIYINVILRDLTAPGKSGDEIIQSFISGQPIRHLYDTCMIAYNDVSDLEKEYQSAFQFYKHYFPDRPTPKVISYISEFGLGTFAYADSLIAVGWDFYLGNSFQYDISYFPKYVQRGMSKEYIVAKSMEALVNNLTGDVKGTRLLDHMVHNGKILYLVDKLLPRHPDTIKHVYSSQQLKWCEDNELQMWTYLLGENLLYSSQMRDFQKLISPSPSSSPIMPPESPGRTANWIGWRIVNNYMKYNPDETLSDLIEKQDAQYILDRAKYKPR